MFGMGTALFFLITSSQRAQPRDVSSDTEDSKVFKSLVILTCSLYLSLLCLIFKKPNSQVRCQLLQVWE